MSKNYNRNNQYYGNREQRRQQARITKQNGLDINNVLNINDYVKHGNTITTSVPQENDELVCKIQYNGEEYEITTGYISVLGIMKIQREGVSDVMDFDKVLRLIFMDGEYERFFANNPRITFNELKNVVEAMIKFVIIDKAQIVEDVKKDEVSEKPDSFRK